VTKEKRHLRTLLAFSLWSLALGRGVVEENDVMSQGLVSSWLFWMFFFPTSKELPSNLSNQIAFCCSSILQTPQRGVKRRLRLMTTQNCMYNFSSHCPTFVFRTCYLEDANLSCMQGGVSELRIVGFWSSAAHFMIGDWLRRSVEIISEMWVPIICTILAVSSINFIFLLEHTDQNCLLECPDQYLQFGSFTDVSSFLQEFKGYVFKIMGGCDKQGFPMKQGVLTQGRVRILMHRGMLLLAL
jgi:hypothetical protein